MYRGGVLQNDSGMSGRNGCVPALLTRAPPYSHQLALAPAQCAEAEPPQCGFDEGTAVRKKTSLCGSPAVQLAVRKVRSAYGKKAVRAALRPQCGRPARSADRSPARSAQPRLALRARSATAPPPLCGPVGPHCRARHLGVHRHLLVHPFLLSPVALVQVDRLIVGRPSHPTETGVPAPRPGRAKQGCPHRPSGHKRK